MITTEGVRPYRDRQALVTRNEAESWLHTMMWVLADSHHIQAAMEVEEAYNRVSFLRWSTAAFKESSYYYIDRGKRGHVTLVLYPPYEARARALLVGILRSIED